MKKFPLIDLVRSFAILAVLAHHLGMSRIVVDPSYYPLAVLWFKFWANGFLGVSLFFVVSGFLITGTIASRPGGLFQPDVQSFYVKRAGRILPLLTLACLLGYSFSQWFFGAPSSAYDFCLRLPQGPHPWIFWASIPTFTENWFKIFVEPLGYHLNLFWIVLWSLAIEEQFYLAYPWVLKKLRTPRRLAFFLLAVIFVAILSMVIPSLFWHKYPIVVFHPATPFNSFAGFGNIAIGCLLYLAMGKYGPRVASDQRLARGLSLVGLLMMGIIYWHVTVSIDFWWMALGRMTISLGLAVFLLGAMNWQGWEAKGWEFLGLPGKFSYGGYLLHSLVLFLIWPMITGMNGLSAILIFSAATTVVSGFSFYYFEMPANRFVRELIGR